MLRECSPPQHFRCHVSHVTCHVSHVLCRTKWWSLSVEGLLSKGPTPSSFLTYSTCRQDILCFLQSLCQQHSRKGLNLALIGFSIYRVKYKPSSLYIILLPTQHFPALTEVKLYLKTVFKNITVLNKQNQGRKTNEKQRHLYIFRSSILRIISIDGHYKE